LLFFCYTFSRNFPANFSSNYLGNNIAIVLNNEKINMSIEQPRKAIRLTYVRLIYLKSLIKLIIMPDTYKKAVLSQGNRAIDAATVVFGLKFADNIHCKFKSIAKLRKPAFRAPNVPAQNRI